MLDNNQKGSDRHESGLDVKENSDGTFTLEWDHQDPRWQFLNDLQEEQILAIIKSAVDSDLHGSEN